jgi:hypothetical protein
VKTEETSFAYFRASLKDRGVTNLVYYSDELLIPCLKLPKSYLTVVQRGITTIDPRQAPAVFYNDMSRADAEYWTSQLLPQSIGVFWSQTTYASWRYIPTTYVLCGQDQCVTLPYAEMMLQTATESRPNMIDTVERCEDGGHSIMLSRVEWTTNMLRRAAGERV